MSSSIKNPSTTGSSIFSSTASYASISTPSSASSRIKCINEPETYEIRSREKRRRLMGRPPNGWTSTRRRKLIRLYLMTDLDVVEILKVLRTKDFAPGIRDVQKQLSILLQPRPDRIRSKGSVTQRRLCQLRECRTAQKYGRQEGPYRQKPKPRGPLTKICPPAAGDTPERANSTLGEPAGDWLLPSLGISCDPLTIRPSELGLQISTGTQEDYLSISNANSISSSGIIGFAVSPSFPEPDTRHQAVEIVPLGIEDSRLILDWRLSDFGQQPVPENPSPSRLPFKPSIVDHPPAHIDGLQSNRRTPLANAECPLSGSKNTHAKSENHLSSLGPRPTVNATFIRDELETRSVPSIGGSSSRSSLLGFKSLRRRLSFKYSHSTIEDVLSILEHFTLSGSSEASSRRAGWRSSKFSLSSLRSKVDIESSLPGEEIFMQPSIIGTPEIHLGACPGYCWEQINKNALRRDDPGVQGNMRICPPLDPQTPVSIRANILSKIIDNTVRAEQINEKDAFGNSLLHLAAALSAKPEDLIFLIHLEAEVNSLNNAGQTFLHLVPRTILEGCDDICPLLELVNKRGFNFHQQDLLGQSVLHLLTRTWISPAILDRIIKTLHDLGLNTTASRDYLGYTVVDQLNSAGTEASEFDYNRGMAVLGLTCETEGHIKNQKEQENYRKRATSSINDYQYTHNYEKSTFIETVADLELYEYHADLLRTIRKAGILPWFEDSTGRNGLHCLAEASLKLPISGFTSSPSQSLGEGGPANANDAREQYLEGLLKAGVDPNNYDKEGHTPFMNFVIHARADEDDASTTRILSRLVGTGSDIHRRNRQGETALHMAVKLGRRAATKFLLKQQANIHARTSSGKGVLALGQEYCEKAKGDEALYAQIMLCMSLAVNFGAVSAPTIFQEWASPRDAVESRETH